jgi:hypothetical protein
VGQICSRPFFRLPKPSDTSSETAVLRPGRRSAEAQALLNVWREDYNRVRPHTALQDRTALEWAEYVTISEVGVETEIPVPQTPKTSTRETCTGFWGLGHGGSVTAAFKVVVRTTR